MKKGATLFAVLWAVLGLGLLVGLPVAIHFILGQYDEAGFSGPQLVFEEQGHSYLAFTLDDYRANEVDNGVVHGSSRSYAQVVDLEDGSLRWSMRLDADNERGDDWGSGELLGQSSRYLFFLRNELYVLDRRDAAPALAFDELERRTGGLPLKSAPWGKDAYRYDEGRGGLLMLALDGRVWFLDGDSLALREAPEVDAARYFHGDPPPPANAGIDWQAPGLTRLPDGRLLILASDHEARALERGEALPAANQRARRQRLSLGTLDWRSPAENRLRPLLDAAFLQAGLLPDPAAAEEPQRLLERPSERQRQHPSLPPEPQPPEEFDERVERFPVPVRSLRRVTPTARNGDAGLPRTMPGGNGSPTWRRRQMPSTVAGATSRRARRRCTVAMPRRCRAAIPGWRAVPGESTATGWCCTGAAWPSVASCCSARCLATAACSGPWSCPSSVPSGCSAWMPTTCFSAAVERKAGGWCGSICAGAAASSIASGAAARHCSGSSGPKANRDRLRPAWVAAQRGRAPIQGFLKTNTPLSTRRVRRMRSSRVRWAARKRGTCASGIARPSLSPGPTAV